MDHENRDGDSDGGLFWSTFQDQTLVQAGSPLEQLLNVPDCGIEALLDEEDVIQEFKHCNESLIARLSKPDALRTLITFITVDPPLDASTARCFRYPFVAVELMTCGPSKFFEALLSPDHPELLDAFWNFIVQPEANDVLAGYFWRAADALLSRYPSQTLEHLRRRDLDLLLEKFLDRLHSRSLVELFARFLCVEQSAHLLFKTDGLGLRLLSRLGDEGISSDTQENITLIVVEILSQKENICCGKDLLRQFASPEAVSLLVNHIVSSRSHVVSAAAEILSSVVLHSCVCPGGAGGSAPHSSLLLPSLALADEEDIVNICTDDEMATEAALLRSTSSPPRSPASGPCNSPRRLAIPADAGNALMQNLCAFFPKIAAQLDTKAVSVCMPQGPTLFVGDVTVEVINLLTTLVKTASVPVLEAIRKELLFAQCMNIFFSHPWSSLLHNSVYLLFSEIVKCASHELVCSLVASCDLVERLAAEFAREESSGTSGRRRTRVGYMGQLRCIACELKEFGGRSQVFQEYLDSEEGWTNHVLPSLERIAAITSEELGGGLRAGDKGMASSFKLTNGSGPTAIEEIIAKEDAKWDSEDPSHWAASECVQWNASFDTEKPGFLEPTSWATFEDPMPPPTPPPTPVSDFVSSRQPRVCDVPETLDITSQAFVSTPESQSPVWVPPETAFTPAAAPVVPALSAAFDQMTLPAVKSTAATSSSSSQKPVVTEAAFTPAAAPVVPEWSAAFDQMTLPAVTSTAATSSSSQKPVVTEAWSARFETFTSPDIRATPEKSSSSTPPKPVVTAAWSAGFETLTSLDIRWTPSKSSSCNQQKPVVGAAWSAGFDAFASPNPLPTPTQPTRTAPPKTPQLSAEAAFGGVAADFWNANFSGPAPFANRSSSAVEPAVGAENIFALIGETSTKQPEPWPCVQQGQSWSAAPPTVHMPKQVPTHVQVTSPVSPHLPAHATPWQDPDPWSSFSAFASAQQGQQCAQSFACFQEHPDQSGVQGIQGVPALGAGSTHSWTADFEASRMPIHPPSASPPTSSFRESPRAVHSWVAEFDPLR